MATSSITDNIVIQLPGQVEAFANAVEEASKMPLKYTKTPIRMVNDREEFIQLMKKRKKLHG